MIFMEDYVILCSQCGSPVPKFLNADIKHDLSAAQNNKQRS